MTAKFQAILTGWIAAISSFVAWLMTVPPEQQTALINPLLDVVPQQWRAALGLAMRGLASVSALYAVYKAAHSGPQSPPANKPE